ncbi:CatA-like O-acetyltransferase [Spongiimicrobium salis]|uniref:CatA-like O-acetyltransferase n=1 Tax=Spongiimicrobium salis TaxID=1667022 RepID=UPI00374CC976
MRKELDIAQWERKEHFEFFGTFEEPFFGVTVDIEVTKAYSYSKKNGYSFFQYYLYCSLMAANKVTPFRYRIQNNRVWIYDQVHASATINRPNGTFGFSYIDFSEDFSEFQKNVNKEITRVRNSTGLAPAVSGENVIHYSSLPWIKFTAISHARSFSFKDSCPKISFGMLQEEDGKRKMPVSIHVHHALMDGYHVGQFITAFQEFLNRY